MTLNELLQSLNLSESEARTYEVLLDFGSLSVTELARRAQIKRTLVYHTTQKLVELGLIREFEKNKKKHYRVASPRAIERISARQALEAREVSETLKDILPEILEKYIARTERPLFTVYTGIEGLKQTYKDMLTEADEILIFASSSARADKEVDALVKEQIAKQEERGIHVRAIVKKYETSGDTRDDIVTQSKTEIRLIPSKEFDSKTQIFIWKDSVALNTVGKEMITTTIRNPEIADTMRMIFNALWKRADVPATKNPDET